MTIMPVYTTFTPTKTPIKIFMAGLTFLIAHISHADDGRTDNQEPINQETINQKTTTLEPIINHAQPELLPHGTLTPTTEPTLAQTPNPAEDTLIADEALLLDNPDLLNHALNSAVMTNHMAGIHALLSIYQKLPKDHQNGILLGYANALAALDKGNAKKAIHELRRIIAIVPEYNVVRFHLARALFMDKQNEAALDQFNKLHADNLPYDVRQVVGQYRQALKQRDSWTWQAGMNLAKEDNINQVPKNTTQGQWTFDKPIDAITLSYQLGADKKWSLPKGAYVGANAQIHGKHHQNHKKYNDHWGRLGANLGFADAKKDLGIEVYGEKRFYGHERYTDTIGIRMSADYRINPKFQSLNAIDISRLTNHRTPRADSNNTLYSTSLIYYPNATRYYLLGADFYDEKVPQDPSDSYERRGIRTAWGQEWAGGLSSRAQISINQRHYQGANLTSGGQIRHDKQMQASLSFWHRDIHKWGITPRLTISTNINKSNDIKANYHKNQMFVEFSRIF